VDLITRDAVPADAAAIGRIKRDGWRAAYRGMLPDASLDALDADELAIEFEKHIIALGLDPLPTRLFLVAQAADAVVGYAIAGPYRWDELPGAGEVYALYVDPDHWRGGSGAALMVAAEERLRGLGHVEAALWALEANRVGRGFYEAVGWRADGVTGERCEIDGAVEVRYRRDLRRPGHPPPT